VARWARDIASYVGAILLSFTRMLGEWLMTADQVIRTQTVCCVWGALMILLSLKIGAMCGTTSTGTFVRYVLIIPLCLLYVLPLAIISVTIQRHLRIERIEPPSLCPSEPPPPESAPPAVIYSAPAEAGPVSTDGSPAQKA
jgi:hypothetical protein